MKIRFRIRCDAPGNTKGDSMNGKLGLRNKQSLRLRWLSSRRAAQLHFEALQRRELEKRAALAWAGTFGMGLSTAVACLHATVRHVAGLDLLLITCIALNFVSLWMCIVGTLARIALERMSSGR